MARMMTGACREEIHHPVGEGDDNAAHEKRFVERMSFAMSVLRHLRVPLFAVTHLSVSASLRVGFFAVGNNPMSSEVIGFYKRGFPIDATGYPGLRDWEIRRDALKGF